MLDSEGLTRTAGKAVKSGRLRVGGIIRTTATGGPGSVSKASIPSRYETILNTAPRERNAFGNRTLRFDDMDNERPGPGSYRIARTLKSKNPSVSKKGNGFFVSSTKIRHEELPPISLPPGPGRYDTSHTPVYRKDHPAPVFCTEIAEKRPKPPAPGPGQYYIPGIATKDADHPNAVFFQRTMQSLLIDPPKPGPGEYDPITFASAGSASAASCVFKSTTNRSQPDQDPNSGAAPSNNPMPKIALDSTHAPPAFKAQEDIKGTFSDVVKHMSHTDLVKTTGGRAFKPKEPVVKPSSAFVTNLLDRFGRPTVRYVAEDDGIPGPGTYTLVKPKQSMLISSSWALSGNERFKEHKTFKPPGPAYYDVPEVKSKVDFHVKRGTQ